MLLVNLEVTVLLIYLFRHFERYDTAGHYQKSNRAILEAMGKCGDEMYLEAISTIKTYTQKDSALLEGQALAIFRYAERDLYNPLGTALMTNWALQPAYPSMVRLIAANFLARRKNLSLEGQDERFATVTGQEKDPDIRLSLVKVLKQMPTAVVLDTLISLYRNDPDYRVQCNVLDALTAFPYEIGQAYANEALRSKNYHIGQCAVNYFVKHGIPQDAVAYWRTAKDTLEWPVQLGLYKAANTHLPVFYEETRDLINYELRRKFELANNPFEKKAIFEALAAFPWNYRYIHRRGMIDSSHIIRSSALQQVVDISQIENFDQFFGAGKNAVLREMTNYFKDALISGDVGLATIAANAMLYEGHNFKKGLDSLSFLDVAQQKFNQHTQIEAYNAIEMLKKHFNDQEAYSHQPSDQNQPINWTKLTDLDGESEAVILTSKGSINLTLFNHLAPAAVANFRMLAEDGFYQNTSFHRVVTNYVVQGGDPRNDTFGSSEQSIRSEFHPMRFDQPGLVGMASAGPHTETCQFFITHVPAFQLDGNYTIFAKVDKGMEVVHSIEPGDRITAIRIRP